MESILITTRKRYVDAEILKSEIIVIDRLLARSVEMQEVYSELELVLYQEQKELLWDALLGVATFWNPDSSRAFRDDQKALTKLNREIVACADKLASLIQARFNISEKSGFTSHEDVHVLEWINRAAENNWHYKQNVQEPLNQLASRYDLKYWPRQAEVIRAIASFAQEANVETTNDWTEELIVSQKCSTSDYVTVIVKAIEDLKKYGPPGHLLPQNFRLSHKAMATYINCSLDLDADDLVTPEYVKRARQNIRERKKNI